MGQRQNIFNPDSLTDTEQKLGVVAAEGHSLHILPGIGMFYSGLKCLIHRSININQLIYYKRWK